MQINSPVKQRIARQFSRAASRYDQDAGVQWQIAQQALTLLKPSKGVVLDMGAGTGRVTRCLQSQHAKVVGLDIAEGMLAYARSQNHVNKNIHWIAADAECLPLMDSSVQALFSSMALQWCDSINKVFAECYRVMQKNSQGVVAIMSKGSFKEWQNCWQQAESAQHINQFLAHPDIMRAAQQAGFKVLAEQKQYQTFHPDLRQLLGSIKSIGANVVTENGNNMPLTRQSLRKLTIQYDKVRDKRGMLPLSYYVSFIQLHKD